MGDKKLRKRKGNEEVEVDEEDDDEEKDLYTAIHQIYLLLWCRL